MIIKPRNEKEFRHILAVDPVRDNTPTIATPEAWQEKRAVLQQTLTQLLGEPSQTSVPEPRPITATRSGAPLRSRIAVIA